MTTGAGGGGGGGGSAPSSPIPLHAPEKADRKEDRLDALEARIETIEEDLYAHTRFHSGA